MGRGDWVPCNARESSTLKRRPSLEIVTCALEANPMQRKSSHSCLAEPDTALSTGIMGELQYRAGKLIDQIR